MRINIHINENGNGYTVTASQESFSDMRIRKGELNKTIYRMIDRLEASERKPVEVYRRKGGKEHEKTY